MTREIRTDPILADLELALEMYDVSASRFGYLVAGDPALVSKLRKGRHPRQEMRTKIQDALKLLDRKGKL